MQYSTLDRPEEFSDSYYGNGEFSYTVTTTPENHLRIKLNFSRGHFLKKLRPAFILMASCILFILIISVIIGEFDEIILGALIFTSLLIVIFWIGPITLFTMIRKVEWTFTENELVIRNFANRKIKFPRHEVKELFITKMTDVSYDNRLDVKYWIVLNVPPELYEDGHLYLLIVQGINTMREPFIQDDLELPASGMFDVIRLSQLISDHWKIPFVF